MSGVAPGALTVGTLLDTDGKPAVLLGPLALARSAATLGHNLLSINWSYAFGPTREFFEGLAGRWYAVFLYPAQFAPRSYLVFFVTLPPAAALTVAAVVLARKASARRLFDAKGAAILVWLAIQAAMVLLIEPVGLEPWVPSILPIFILLGLHRFEPMVQSGGARVVSALVLILLTLNGFAGLSVQHAAENNYCDAKAGPILPTVGSGDLVVLGHWSLRHYFTSHSPDRHQGTGTRAGLGLLSPKATTKLSQRAKAEMHRDSVAARRMSKPPERAPVPVGVRKMRPQGLWPGLTAHAEP